MANVDVVLNRKARHLVEDRAPLRAAILEAASPARVHETRSLEELDAVARDIATRGSDCVVLAGGDGSHMAGVTALARAFESRELPRIALAPGGTVSTAARNWGMRATPRYARALVRAAHERESTTTTRATLRVRDDAGGDRTGFMFGAGLVASFFDVYYASPKSAGYADAARIVGRIFVESFVGGPLARRVLEPVPGVLAIDGAERAPRAWSLVVASVVRNLGLHMMVTYRAGEDPMRFHAVASALAPRALGPQMPRVLAGKRLRGEHHVDELARALTLTLDGTRGAYVLDGEMIEARRVEVTPGTAIRVVTPR
jgi:diacylglycerol kinase family enzyme